MLFMTPLYLALMLPGMAFMLWAQYRVHSAYGRYSKVPSRSRLTGAQVARRLLDADGLNDVTIERIGGRLSDHYDPRKKVLRLSTEVHDGSSLAAIGIAAHELGHAVQHAVGYAPLNFRQAFYPVAAFASGAWSWLFILGVMLGMASPLGQGLMTLALVALCCYALFALVTLPVEYDASRRALLLLEGSRTLETDELQGAGKVLSAAGLTYVASALQAVLTVVYLLMRSRD